MGSKGPINAVFDVPAVNVVIVYANQYYVDVKEQAERITNICNKLTNDDALNGGDGEEIKACMKDIVTGCQQILRDNEKIVKGFNAGLERMLEMRKGKTTAQAKDSSATVAKNSGVLKE